MHSPGHRANLLDPKVDSIGIAIVRRGNQLYAVEDFASTVQTLSLNQQEHTVAERPAQIRLACRCNTEDARQTCAMSTGYAGSRQPWFIMRYTASSLDQIPSQLKSRLSTGKYHQAVVGACQAPQELRLLHITSRFCSIRNTATERCLSTAHFWVLRLASLTHHSVFAITIESAARDSLAFQHTPE